MSQQHQQPDDGAEDVVADANGGAGLAGAASQDSSKTVVHYRVDLPPYFHGDGKDKESFALWKTRLELAVKACADGQKLNIATILPTRLSGDALAYWLSLAPAVQQDYDQCTAKLNDVFGRKEFLLHFQTFVNARQRLSKEPLEVYAAEITRLVLEAFPNYGKPAIAMERFRRFVAGLDPILQSKCHEHGAATLEDALAVACKWERAQEALRLLPPQFPVTNTPYATTLTSRDEPLSAMVSNKHERNQTDCSNELLDAIKQLSRDVQTLKLHVATQGPDVSHTTQSHTPRSDFSKHGYDRSDYSRGDRGRERYRRSPSVSPVRDYRTSTPTFSRPSSRSYSDYSFSRHSPVHHDHRRSPDHHVRRRSPDHRLQSSGPSPPPYHRDRLSSCERHSRPRCSERWPSSHHHDDRSYHDYDCDSTSGTGRHRSPSAHSGRDRQRQYNRDHHVTFSDDHDRRKRVAVDTESQVSASSEKAHITSMQQTTRKTFTRNVLAIIENNATKVYIDSGSDISLISEAFRMSIPSLRTKTLQRPQVVPRAVTGDYLDNLGTLSVNMRLGSEMFTHTVQVVRNVTQPVILGWDFLFAHFAVLDLKVGLLAVGSRARVPLLSATETAPISCNNDNPTHDIGSSLSIDSEQLKQQQHSDECLSTVISWVKDSACRPPIGKLRYSTPLLRKLWHEFPNLTIRHGILCRKSKQSPHSPLHFQVVLPNALVPTALAALHGNQLSGHLNAERTLQRARRICYWPYMTRDVHAFCSECLPCQKRGSPVPHERAPLQSIQADRPFQKVAADITELPITSQGNRYALVITDYFTRYANLFPLKDQRAITVAKCIFEDYIRQHGLPESIHTDQGRQFESDLVKHLCRLLGINKTRTTPYHAQSDGMVERLNRTLKDQLAKYIAQTGGEWDQFLPQVELAYNSSIHSSTGFSPFFLVQGREPNLPNKPQSAPPSPHASVSSASPPASPVSQPSMCPSASPVSRPVVSRSGRRICRPQRNRDFVT